MRCWEAERTLGCGRRPRPCTAPGGLQKGPSPGWEARGSYGPRPAGSARAAVATPWDVGTALPARRARRAKLPAVPRPCRYLPGPGRRRRRPTPGRARRQSATTLPAAARRPGAGSGSRGAGPKAPGRAGAGSGLSGAGPAADPALSGSRGAGLREDRKSLPRSAGHKQAWQLRDVECSRLRGLEGLDCPGGRSVAGSSSSGGGVFRRVGARARRHIPGPAGGYQRPAPPDPSAGLPSALRSVSASHGLGRLQRGAGSEGLRGGPPPVSLCAHPPFSAAKRRRKWTASPRTGTSRRSRSGCGRS